MSHIIDYNTLKSEITLYCARNDTDFSNAFETMVTMAESRMIYGFGAGPHEPDYSPALRPSGLESTATVTITSGSGDLPTDFIESRALHRDSDEVGLDYLAPNKFHIMDANLSAQGDPGYYTIEGNKLKVSQSYSGSLNLLYFSKPTGLNGTNSVNELIGAHPDAYFASTLIEAYSFIRNDAEYAKQIGRYNGVAKAINRTSKRSRYTGQPMRMRSRGMP